MSLSDDPAHCLYENYDTLIGEHVAIHLQDNAFIRGTLFSIDPENGNVILFSIDLPFTAKDGVRTQTIMGHSIAKIVQDEDGLNMSGVKKLLEEYSLKSKSDSLALSPNITVEKIQAVLQQVTLS